jgi:tetratricopeptide (TPR) repeat protein
MRRVAVLCFIGASLIGAFPIEAPLWGQGSNVQPFETIIHAEDSPSSFADNQVYYGLPHMPDPAGYSETDGAVSPTSKSSPAGTVSVERLQHPLSRKGASLIRKAQNFSSMGDHGKAIAELQLALKERSAIPYAHSLLGSEYLRINEVPAAIEALEQAVKLLPREAANHANLGYALFLVGYAERGEQEVRRALELDHNNEKSRLVLSIITHAGGKGQ